MRSALSLPLISAAHVTGKVELNAHVQPVVGQKKNVCSLDDGGTFYIIFILVSNMYRYITYKKRKPGDRLWTSTVCHICKNVILCTYFVNHLDGSQENKKQSNKCCIPWPGIGTRGQQ